MKLSSFDFTLPEHLIAQRPLPERDASRLMVVRREAGTIGHHTFRELPQLLESDHFLVLNTTRVFPARLWAQRPGKTGRIEILLVREQTPGTWVALLRPAKKAQVGQELWVADLQVHVRAILPEGARIIEFAGRTDPRPRLEELGEPPLPLYIRRQEGEDLAEDRLRYQTVFANQPGSIAAPTAGLHFSPRVLQDIARKGVPVIDILLHIGYGTFQPVRCEQIEKHRMEPEYFQVSDESAAAISRCRARGMSLIAVGTTTTRVLEHLARRQDFLERGSSGYCDLFIYPGFRFKAVRGLLTNFHLPRSTLFLLVCAFAGRDLMMDCYRQAVTENYRFFSYGDCMLIL